MTLYSAIEHAKIVLMINDPQKSKGFRSLHFREAFHDPNLFSDELCEQIKKDEFYKSFKSLNDSEFINLARFRNEEIHPRLLNLNLIDYNIAAIGEGQNLNNFEMENFLLAKRIYEKIKSFSETIDLIEFSIN